MTNDFHPEIKFHSDIKEKIEEAKKVFIEKNGNQLGTEVLLLALVELKSSILNTILSDNNISRKDIIDYIKDVLIFRKNNEGYNSKFLEVVEEANRIAKLDRSDVIYDEHLLYAVINIKDTIILKTLENFNLSVEDIYEYIDFIFEDEECEYLVNLSREAENNKLNPFIGRDEYLDKIIRVLSKKQKNNPLLIGSAGVGKSALVEGLAMKYLKLNPSINIYRLDIGSIVAGTKYRGDLEERLIEVFDKIRNTKNIIFIDEIHNIVSPTSSENTLDIANILKPILSKNEIKVIGATTLDEYYQYFDRDKALTRRFQNIFIDEPSKEETLLILKGIKKSYENYHKIKYSNKILEYIVNISKLLPNRRFPDKTIDILDEAGLLASIEKRNVLKKDVEKVTIETLGVNYEKIKNVLKKQDNLNYSNVKEYYNKYLMLSNKENNIVTIKLSQEKLEKIIDDLTLVFNIKEEQILELDLSFFTLEHQMSSLIGAPSGYVGYENGGMLTEHVYKYPISVIIIKNYSFGNVNIKKQIEQIIKKGRIKDYKGKTVFFTNSIFLFVEEESKFSAGFVSQNITKNEINQFIDIYLK